MLLKSISCCALLLILSFFSVNASCPKDVSTWCSSVQTAMSCDVYSQCFQHVWKPANPYFDEKLVNENPNANANADLVNFTLYYETLCPDCRNFMTGQLWKAYSSVASIVNLTVVPYGNAKETWRNETKLWQYTCQHGEDECYGNVLHTCLIYYRPLTQDHLPFIHCMESNNEDKVKTAATKCGQQLNITLDAIFTCASNRLGNTLQHQMAILTDALQPPHKYVPWVTLNGVHTEDIEQAAEADLVGLLCKTYLGTDKPAACNQQEPVHLEKRKCLKEN